MKHGSGIHPEAAATNCFNCLQFSTDEKEQKQMIVQKLQSTWTLQADTNW